MKILAIDLGKQKSVACTYDTEMTEGEYETLRTTPAQVHDLLVKRQPHRVVIEICASAGWIADMCGALGVELQVANPNHDAWRWKNVKNKSDRGDALKMAQLSVANQLPQVKVPPPAIRQWRNLIAYRHKLVHERTRVKNAIRAILHGQGLSQPARKKGWTEESIKYLVTLSKDMEQVNGEGLWQGQLAIELQRLAQNTALIDQVTKKLDGIADQDKRVRQLRSIPGVGPRLAEVVVATIDDPHRFKTAKQVGAYAGLTPRQFQSGTMDRKGRISCQGNPLLRALLVEISWLGRQHNSWIRQLHDHISRGSKTRKKIAIIAVARRLLVVCWAMLRDGTRWHAPGMVAQPAPVAN